MSGDSTTKVIAHRGASADHPENTRDAFIGAAEQGADWVELDVRHTRDGSLIVHHDAWYHDERIVWSTPSHERPEALLDLEAALESCLDGSHTHGRSLGVNIEIKNMAGDLGGDHVPRSLEVVHGVLSVLGSRSERGVHEEILISSFDPETIDLVRELDGPPTAQLVVDLNSWPDVVESTAGRGHSHVHPWDPFVDELFLESAWNAGLGVNTWTVDDPARIAELARMGVDGIVTNVPRTARQVIDA